MTAAETSRPLLDLILTTPVNGAPMELSEHVRYVLLALLGGMDTTSGLTGSSLIHIAADPTLRQELIDHRELLKLATEEFLRHHTPTQGSRARCPRMWTSTGSG
jgi:cytochrome P450